MEKVTSNIKIPDNLEVLKKHFSHCFNKEGDFDFDKFKSEVSKNNEINFSKESFGLDWLGKSYARLLASDSTKTLLKEDIKFNKQEKNKNSENLLIKGDNLEVLKHLSNAYHEQIKMIYIDPPYNTGSDGFVYQDDRKFNVDEFSQLAGVDKEKAKRILDFVDSKSNSHSAWLTFMYPRLYIAKQLLKDDGVIFISIDDNEVAQLRLLMDEIFGEENFVDCVVWNRKRGRDNSAKWFSKSHEYLLVYGKLKNNLIINTLEINDETKNAYKNPDNDKRGVYRMLALWARGTQGGVKYSFTNKDGVAFSERLWLCSKKNMEFMDKENKLIVRGDNLYRKMFLSEHNGRIAETIWDNVSNTANASDEIKNLFGKIVFDTSKPTPLLRQAINLSIDSKNNDIILDFFAGSGTTADAIMQLNANDGGNRKFILAQLPEEIDKNKSQIAYDFVKNELKIDKPTIFEITKERIIRASNKIMKENIDKSTRSEKIKCDGIDGEHCISCKGEHTIKIEATKAKDLSNLDLGFKIFETIPIWEDYNIEAEEFSPQLKLFDETKLNEEDLKTLLVTWKTYDNIYLTQDLKEIDLDGYIGYYFEKNLYLMDKGFETKHLKKILEEIDKNDNFSPSNIIVFGYHFQSKNLREIAENVKSYANKKKSDIEFIVRY